MLHPGTRTEIPPPSLHLRLSHTHPGPSGTQVVLGGCGRIEQAGLISAGNHYELLPEKLARAGSAGDPCVC
jgi:hypothetical protein